MTDVITNIQNTTFADFFDENIDQEKRQLVTIYHSIPKEVMLNQEYLKMLRDKFGTISKVKHILDCAESNIPALSKSKATYFTERIKMVCPHMFPTATNQIDDLKQKMREESVNASKNFEEIS